MTWLGQAGERINDALGSNAMSRWAPQLRAIAELQSGTRVLKRLCAAGNPEDVKDVLVEIRIGLCLVGQGFEVSIEPHGQAGPDLGAAKGNINAVVEVCRLRSAYEDFDAEELKKFPGLLPPMGDTERDLRRMRQKIISKFPQLRCSEPSVLAVWNDQDCMIEGEAMTVMQQIAVDASHNRITPPPSLEFLVYGSSWIACRNQQQFYTYSHRETQSRDMVAWRLEWEGSQEEQLVRTALHLLSTPPSG